MMQAIFNFAADVSGMALVNLMSPVPYILAAFLATRRAAPFRIPAALTWGAWVFWANGWDFNSYYTVLFALVNIAHVWLAARAFAGLFVLMARWAPPHSEA